MFGWLPTLRRISTWLGLGLALPLPLPLPLTRRDYARNPYPPTRSGLRYPNSGLLIGTAKGFEQLQPAYAAMPQVGLGSGLGMGFRTPR